MAAQTYNIEFDGYWREVNKSSVPAKSGIYCVYCCVHNVPQKTVTLNRLVYIGEAVDVNVRLANHEKLPTWKKYLKPGEELCFSFGAVASTERNRCEAAMIFKHKPPVNTEYVNEFPFDQTTISLTGKTNLLTTLFTVNRT